MRRNDPSQFEFKKGQKIICISNASEKVLKVGKVYTCQYQSPDNRWITIEEHPISAFYANRFIPDSELIKELI